MKKKCLGFCGRFLGERYFIRQVKKQTLTGRVCLACRAEKARRRSAAAKIARKESLMVEYDTLDYPLHEKYRLLWKPTYVPTKEELGIE